MKDGIDVILENTDKEEVMDIVIDMGRVDCILRTLNEIKEGDPLSTIRLTFTKNNYETRLNITAIARPVDILLCRGGGDR